MGDKSWAILRAMITPSTSCWKVAPSESTLKHEGWNRSS